MWRRVDKTTRPPKKAGARQVDVTRIVVVAEVLGVPLAIVAMWATVLQVMDYRKTEDQLAKAGLAACVNMINPDVVCARWGCGSPLLQTSVSVYNIELAKHCPERVLEARFAPPPPDTTRLLRRALMEAEIAAADVPVPSQKPAP